MADKVERVLDDGITYELKLASKMTTNNGGYMGVVLQGNLYYPKNDHPREGCGPDGDPRRGLHTPARAV